MLTSDGRRKLIEAAMFGAPIALVLGAARMLGGPGEAQAEGGPAPAAVSAVDFAIKSLELELDDTQKAAAAHVASLAERPFGPTPLFHGAGEKPVLVIGETGDPQAARPVPEFTVSAILASARGNTALIGGKAYRTGDAFGETGWIVSRIDAVDRSVMMRDPETERVVLGYVEMP